MGTPMFHARLSLANNLSENESPSDLLTDRFLRWKEEGMWSLINKRFRNRIVGKRSPMILVCAFLLGAGGLIATADNASRIIARFQIFQDPNGTFATLN